MISVLAQERLLGAALGSILAGYVVLEQRRSIYKSILDIQSQFSPKTEVREPMFERRSDFEFAHLWNRTVDRTLGPVIVSLGSHGW